MVLARKRGEKIAIGPDVVISVERITYNEVRIGIQAPKDVLILRTELAPSDELRMKRLTKPPGAG